MKSLLTFSMPVIVFCFLILGFFVVPSALASDSAGHTTDGTLPNPLGDTSTIPQLLDKIVGFLFAIAVPIAAGMIIYGAFQILFAGGDPEKFKTGKKTILYTVIAFVIIAISKGLAKLIKDILGVSS